VRIRARLRVIPAAIVAGQSISRRIRWPNAAGNLYAALAFDHSDVVLALQVQPELRAVAEARRADYAEGVTRRSMRNGGIRFANPPYVLPAA